MARIQRVKRRHGEAIAFERLSGGPDRVEAPCPHFGTCGGCRWQDLRYERQLEHKQQQVLDALQRIAGLPEPPLEPIVPGRARVRLPQQARVRLDEHARGRLARLPQGGPLGGHRPHPGLPADGRRAATPCARRFATGRAREGLEAYDQRTQHRLPAAPRRARGRAHGRVALHPRHRRRRAARRRGAPGAARGARARASSACCTRSTTASPRSPAASRRGRCSGAPGSRRRSAACACASRPARSCRRTPRWPTCSTRTRSSRPG